VTGTFVNLGCGLEHLKGCVNVDISPDVGADVVCDFNVFPWPLESDKFDQATAQDVIEHVINPVAFMEETWRILKPKGLLNLRTPHFASDNSWIDLTHLHHFHQNSLDYFDPETKLGAKYPFYTRRKFKILRKETLTDGSIFLLMEKRDG
jgi:SAM-dependent methyltransferase